MQSILNFLGFLSKERNEVLPDRSWLSCSVLPDYINCEWLLKTEAFNLVKQEADSRLILRIRDVPGNADCESITTVIATETSIYTNEAMISLPTNSGMLLAELGFKDSDGIFIVLEYQAIDLGPRTSMNPVLEDWFSAEEKEKSIHQKMYELSTRYSLVGGSERTSY